MNDAQPTHFFEGFRVDARRRLLLRSTGDVIPLPPKVFDLLLCFLERPGELLDKRALIDTVWPDVVVEENNLNQCISALRRVLGERPEDHRFIVTVPGRGYRFVARVTTAPDGPNDVAAQSNGAEALSDTAAAAPRRRRGYLYASLGLAAGVGLVALLLLRGGETPAVAPGIEARPTVSLEAQREYLQARAALEAGKRLEALALLEEATRREPRFAAAHAQLALLYARSFIDWAWNPAVPMDPGVLRERVNAHAGRALDIDQGQAVAHAALGVLNLYAWRWCDAERAHRSAYEVGRHDPNVLLFYSEFETFVGAYAVAESLAQRAFEVDPPSPSPVANPSGPIYALWLANVYSGDVDGALRYLDEDLAVHPGQVVAHLNVGFVQARRGDRAAAEAAFRTVEELLAGGDTPPTLAVSLAYGYSRIGRAADVERLFAVVHAADGSRVGPAALAVASLAIGNETRALAMLDEALRRIEAREPASDWWSLMQLKHNLTGNPLLETEPFAARRARINGWGSAGGCDAGQE